jgi:hypothetical protein
MPSRPEGYGRSFADTQATKRQASGTTTYPDKVVALASP